jgi:hypothetical protein
MRYKGTESHFEHNGHSYYVVSNKGKYELFITEPAINKKTGQVDTVSRLINTGTNKKKLIEGVTNG